MIIPRQSNELAISHAIRLMRFKGNPDVAAVCASEYGGFRKRSLIPWKADLINGMLSAGQGREVISATGLPFLIKLGGRPWPKQLVPGRELTEDSYWAYLLEKSNRAQHLRCCGDCAAIDMEKYGYSWWRVEHNLPGVTSCIHHGTVLADMPWEDAFDHWGQLPHHYRGDEKFRQDGSFELSFSQAISQFQNQNRYYCPFVVAATALETLRRGEGCDRGELVGLFMDRFSHRFSAKTQARIGRNEAVAPDIQVLRLLVDGVVETPLATALIAMTIFPSVQRLNMAYDSMLSGSIVEPHGEITPGPLLDRALNWYPQFALRVVFH